MGSNEDAIRFGVRQGEEIWSLVWILWATAAGDVYLTARTAGRWFKLSLHKTIWRAAWTSESGMVSEGGDRVLARWNRPDPFTKGWTRGPAILVGNVGQSAHLSVRTKESRKPMTWHEPPPVGHGLCFTVLFSSAGTPADDIHRVLRPGDGIAGRIGVSTGGSVWLVTRVTPLFARDAQLIEQHLREAKISLRHGGTPEHFGETSLIQIADDSSGLPFVMDVAFGKENFTVGEQSCV